MKCERFIKRSEPESLLIVPCATPQTPTSATADIPCILMGCKIKKYIKKYRVNCCQPTTGDVRLEKRPSALRSLFIQNVEKVYIIFYSPRIYPNVHAGTFYSFITYIILLLCTYITAGTYALCYVHYIYLCDVNMRCGRACSIL